MKHKLHGRSRQPFEWNYFPLLTGRTVLSNKKRNLRKYSIDFFKAFSKKIFWKKAFSKKKLFGGPCTSDILKAFQEIKLWTKIHSYDSRS